MYVRRKFNPEHPQETESSAKLSTIGGFVHYVQQVGGVKTVDINRRLRAGQTASSEQGKQQKALENMYVRRKFNPRTESSAKLSTIRSPAADVVDLGHSPNGGPRRCRGSFPVSRLGVHAPRRETLAKKQALFAVAGIGPLGFPPPVTVAALLLTSWTPGRRGSTCPRVAPDHAAALFRSHDWACMRCTRTHTHTHTPTPTPTHTHTHTHTHTFCRHSGDQPEFLSGKLRATNLSCSETQVFHETQATILSSVGKLRHPT
jgi:hypothetical protein